MLHQYNLTKIFALGSENEPNYVQSSTNIPDNSNLPSTSSANLTIAPVESNQSSDSPHKITRTIPDFPYQFPLYPSENWAQDVPWDPQLLNPNLTLQHNRSFNDPDHPLFMTPLEAELWEPNNSTLTCRFCDKKFTLFLRRHHCRRCGLVLCDDCTQFRSQMASQPDSNFNPADFNPLQRTCVRCDGILSYHRQNTIPSMLGRGHRTNSQNSLLVECPSCNLSLTRFGTTKEAHEAHIRDCLENGTSQQSSLKYLVYTLKSQENEEDAEEDGETSSQSNHGECVICFEDLELGNRVARLSCWCIFHKNCIEEWFQRSSNCPVHYK